MIRAKLANANDFLTKDAGHSYGFYCSAQVLSIIILAVKILSIRNLMPSTQDAKHAVNIGIYKVIVPNEEYKKIFAASETFQYQGRIKKIAKSVTAGALFIPVTLASAFLFFPAQLIHESIRSERRNNFALRMLSMVTRSLDEIPRYGYSCQTCIPASWIIGKVNFRGEMRITNPNFIRPAGDTNIIYVLDSRHPAEVWQKGISYMGMEHPFPVNPPHGKVIFFSDPGYAFDCAWLRKNGEMYDKHGGWRRYHAWTDEERTDVIAGTQVTDTVVAHTDLPRDVANITSEYLGFFPKKLTTKPTIRTIQTQYQSGIPGVP